LFEEFENIEMKLFHYSGNKAAMYAFGIIWMHWYFAETERA